MLSVGDEGLSHQQERTGSQPPGATDHSFRKTHTQRSRPGKGTSNYSSAVALTPNLQQGLGQPNWRGPFLAYSWDFASMASAAAGVREASGKEPCPRTERLLIRGY